VNPTFTFSIEDFKH